MTKGTHTQSEVMFNFLCIEVDQKFPLVVK